MKNKYGEEVRGDLVIIITLISVALVIGAALLFPAVDDTPIPDANVAYEPPIEWATEAGEENPVMSYGVDAYEGGPYSVCFGLDAEANWGGSVLIPRVS